MRFAIFLASVLVLSGCATVEPQEETPVASQVTEQEASDAETQDEAEVADLESAEPESSESTEEVSEEREEESVESADTREPEESEQEESSEEENELAEADEEQAQEPEPTEEPSPTPTPEETTVGYTLADVAKRDSAAECWAAVDGKVYDLTNWIRSHPGGSGAILNLCGKDATSSFTSQHGGQARPTSTLDGYYLAPLIG